MYETNEKPTPAPRGELPSREPRAPLIVKNATFITSAANEKQFLSFDKPTIAVCGKSNVGKSSFINMLANRKKLAKTSSEPGRTRLVNYFDFGAFILADLPGYGFARVSKAEKEKWAKTLNAFFADKKRISHVFLLVDSRHDPTADDMQMIEFLHYHIIPFTVVLTKADKLSKMKLKEHVKAIAADLYLGTENLLATSAQTGYGKDLVLLKIAEVTERTLSASGAEELGNEDSSEMMIKGAVSPSSEESGKEISNG